MTPYLVTPPTSEVVPLPDMWAHLRVTHGMEDELISAMTAAAVGYLDGWTGVLGRCIGAQTWCVTVNAAGFYTLPMPDVTEAVAGYAAGDVTLDVKATALGPQITVSEPCDVTFTCEMKPPMLALTAQAVKLLVGHWYNNREAASEKLSDTPMAVDMIISTIRWRRV